MVIVVLETTMMEKLELLVELEEDGPVDVYGRLERTAELDVEADDVVVGVMTEDDRVEVTTTVAPRITVTVLVVVVERLPLFRMADPTTEAEDDDELAILLVAVDNVYLDEVWAAVVLLLFETAKRDEVVVVILVVVDRKTPLLALNEVLVELFAKHDAGMVKQHGRVFVYVVLGSKTPV